MNSAYCTHLICLALFFGYYCNGQTCPKIESPLDGDVDVPVDTQISWNIVEGIDGYSVSLGTTEGGSDILNSRSAALVNYLVPVVGLPDNTEIFVTISLFLEDGSFITCPSERFTTVDVTVPPDCTELNDPLNRADNVNLGEDISWDYATTATGYKLSIGITETGAELLPETDVGNVLSYRPLEALPATTEIFVTITPYNENGDATSCSYRMFTTGESAIDCELFAPIIGTIGTVGLCKNGAEVVVSPNAVANGFRWYKVEGSNEVLISEEEAIAISEIGSYRYEAYNSISLFGDTAECTSTQLFSVVGSEAAIIQDVKIRRGSSGIDLEVIATGIGDYEYALDDEEGPYYDSAIFSSVEEGDHRIFIRDKNGCGTTTYLLVQTVSEDNFPKFFTPNNDGINDYWQLLPTSDGIDATLKTIFVFDRYGNLMSQLSPQSKGWDGTFNGKPMPSSTYWYKAISVYDKKVNGYFTLKR